LRALFVLPSPQGRVYLGFSSFKKFPSWV
jgi:hypothetical protein